MSDLSWLNPTPHAIAEYASRPLSPLATQHSLPSGRYSLLGPAGWIAPALPGTLIGSPRGRPVGSESQLEVSRNVLCESGAEVVPSRLLLNKIDRVSEADRAALRAKHPDAILHGRTQIRSRSGRACSVSSAEIQPNSMTYSAKAGHTHSRSTSEV